jgi:hypothetical protein
MTFDIPDHFIVIAGAQILVQDADKNMIFKTEGLGLAGLTVATSGIKLVDSSGNVVMILKGLAVDNILNESGEPIYLIKSAGFRKISIFSGDGKQLLINIKHAGLLSPNMVLSDSSGKEVADFKVSAVYSTVEVTIKDNNCDKLAVLAYSIRKAMKIESMYPIR